jgi:hypothetical protein
MKKMTVHQEPRHFSLEKGEIERELYLDSKIILEVAFWIKD